MSMPFASPESLMKAKTFFDNAELPACNCSSGVRMCHTTPCIGTVDDIERLIDAGYAKDLMLDWWVGQRTADDTASSITKSKNDKESIAGKNNPFSDDLPYLAPALVGRESQAAPFGKTGSCTLLKDNKCSVHDKGLKPLQGKFACCKSKAVYLDKDGDQVILDERIPILNTWNTQRGKDLIERWKKEVSYDGEDKLEAPNNLFDLLDVLLGLTERHDKISERSGIPEPDYDKMNREAVTKIYERPY